MSNIKNDNKELEDSFDKNEIEQLHKAVLGFSGQSFELKKLCITIEISACTLTTTIFRDKYDSGEFLFALKIIVLFIPIFFYLVDICTYYYQDKLRNVMLDIENKIRKRHNVHLKDNRRFSKKNNTFIRRLFRSIRNGSNIIYWGLIVFAVLFFIFT